MTGQWNEVANVLLGASISSFYAMYVTIQLASASENMVYTMLAIEFLLHIATCYRIIRLQNQIGTVGVENELIVNRRNEEVVNLILSETIEALTPCAYGMGFALAYYGPNKASCGNVQNFGNLDEVKLNCAKNYCRFVIAGYPC